MSDDHEVLARPRGTDVQELIQPLSIRLHLDEDDDLALQSLEAADGIAQDGVRRLLGITDTIAATNEGAVNEREP